MVTRSRSHKPLRVFYSYSHKDETYRKRLQESLALLRRQGFISEWHDRDIDAGDEWKTAIDAHLEAADLILLLISPSFIASDYCYEKEMRRALARHDAGAARVIPVIIRPADWHSARFGELQALPTDGKPVTRWRNRDDAWLDITQGIRKIVAPPRSSKPPVAKASTPQPPAKPTGDEVIPASTLRRRRETPQNRIAPDTEIMQKRVEALVPTMRHDLGTHLCLIVAGDAAQVLRPAALNEALGRHIQQDGQFGKVRFLDAGQETRVSVTGDALMIEQDGAAVLVNQQGSIRLRASSLHRKTPLGPATGLVQEDVEKQIHMMLRFTATTLNRIDPKRTLTEISLLLVLLHGSVLGWKTEQEYQEDATGWSIYMRPNPLRVELTPSHVSRAMLSQKTSTLAEDLIVLLRRHIVDPA